MIRTATREDIPRIVEMGLRFHRESTYRNHLSSNPEQIGLLAEKVMTSGICLVSEQNGVVCGMIGVVLFPHFISGELIAGEVAWWVEPEHRGSGLKLMREAERRAREAGATKMQMIAPNAHVAAVYERLSYEFVESAYQKTL